MFRTFSLACLAVVAILPGRAAERFRGGLLDPGANAVYTWGDGLFRIDMTSGAERKLASGWFGEGGCVYDVDRDRTPDVILQSGPALGQLVWISGATGESHTIDTGIEMHDCIVTMFHGHTGVLMVQRGMQLRFYTLPDRRGGEWGYTELYSFYTPSYQTSLVLADVDGDGKTDLFCGNYWMKAPAAFELPWHIFAIDTYSETPASAMLRLVLLDSMHLLAAQGHMRDARLAIFTKPADPEQLWQEQRLEGDLHLVNAHAAIAWGEGFVVGENNGTDSRILYFDRAGSKPVEISRGTPVIAFWRWNEKLLALTPADVRAISMNSVDTHRRPESNPPGSAKTGR